MVLRRASRSRALESLAIATAAALALSTHALPAAAEPAACLSPDPAMWPAAARPYFMIQMPSDTSMSTAVTTASACGYGSSRVAHARCAVRDTISAYAGRVNFGLSQYAETMSACTTACYGTCAYSCFPQETATTGTCLGCGPRPGGVASARAGANILVPVQVDSFWTTPSPSNVSSLLSYLDNDCSGNTEIFASGASPINGVLRDFYRYFNASWTAPDSSRTFTTPFNSMDRACRSANVILIADSDENCDTLADAQAAAAALFSGVSVGGTTYSIKTYVIQFAGGTTANMNSIAAAGGTGSATLVTNEVELGTALHNILNAALPSETCDNVDNNCNGCTDEGSRHYCDVQSVPSACCAWSTTAQRSTCLTNYRATITASNPSGDRTRLPCTTVAQSTVPSTWLCYDPGETCDAMDNNCVDGVDEMQLRCGSPLHCPGAETCNGIDDNCNGTIDEGCPTTCTMTPEICDGCDNDCDGRTDNGVAPIACGPTGPGEPANCAGFLLCRPPQNVPPGTCAPGGGFNPCNNSPQPEACDNLDNNCNAIIDDAVPSVSCVPAGTPGSLVYGGTSQCRRGATACVAGTTVCQGFVGPNAEVCDGVDNDCDGSVDESVSGLGQPCGASVPPCTPGTTACVNGAIVCQGGTSARPEVCDGIDNDCNGSIDDGALADAPAPGMAGCWDLPGNCCTFPASNPTLQWCPPAGASCNGTGTLTGSCSVGALACVGGAWSCRMPSGPAPEVCDGIDNDCNGMIDDGILPGVGAACGSTTPPCSAGVQACVSGSLTCSGGTMPGAETCDGVDNDCNGIVDDPMRLDGAPCTAMYDATMYPGSRSAGPCRSGHMMCGGASGASCVDAIAPQPEVCDGIDNDCDGAVDETGVAPDGIDGTADPSDSSHVIGASCGASGTSCGHYECAGGAVACSMGPRAEACNCVDDDCDGVTDNEAASGMPPICATGASCVRSGTTCGCAVPCSDDGICAAGEACIDVTSSATGMSLGRFCVPGAMSPDAGADAMVVDAATDASIVDVATDLGIDAPDTGVIADSGSDGAVAMDAGARDGGTMTNPSGCACRSGPAPTRAPPWSLLVVGLAIVPIVRRRARREVAR